VQTLNEELLKMILLEIKNNSKVTQVELAKKYFYSERTIRRYFKVLKNSGKIKLINIAKKRAWKILWWYVQFK